MSNPTDTAKSLIELISFTMLAHATEGKKPHKAVRLWDQQTPYGIHPVWCAITILTETSLDKPTRENGAHALLLHDIIEDTRAGLPEDTPPQVRALVEGMTFASFDEEMAEVWHRGKEILLLKLYDKVSNLLDAAWMKPEKLGVYVEHTRRLMQEVRTHYGYLNIVALAEAITLKHKLGLLPQPPPPQDV